MCARAPVERPLLEGMRQRQLLLPRRCRCRRCLVSSLMEGPRHTAAGRTARRVHHTYEAQHNNRGATDGRNYKDSEHRAAPTAICCGQKTCCCCCCCDATPCLLSDFSGHKQQTLMQITIDGFVPAPVHCPHIIVMSCFETMMPAASRITRVVSMSAASSAALIASQMTVCSVAGSRGDAGRAEQHQLGVVCSALLLLLSPRHEHDVCQQQRVRKHYLTAISTIVRLRVPVLISHALHRSGGADVVALSGACSSCLQHCWQNTLLQLLLQAAAMQRSVGSIPATFWVCKARLSSRQAGQSALWALLCCCGGHAERCSLGHTLCCRSIPCPLNAENVARRLVQ
jgi:hypothetical protein